MRSLFIFLKSLDNKIKASIEQRPCGRNVRQRTRCFGYAEGTSASLSLNVVLLSLTMLASSLALFAPATNAEEKKARSTDSFIDSIGVVAHIGYYGTSYSQFDTIVKPRLQELGVRHVRTNVDPGARAAAKTVSRLKELANMGIKFNLVMDPTELSLTETMKVLKTFGDAIESVEGPNEWNAPKLAKTKSYKGKYFPEGLKLYQADLYKAVKSDPATARIPVISPALSNETGLAKTTARMGKVACDINNAHEYPGGRHPNNAGLPYHIPNYLSVCGKDKPLISTETGYNNARKLSKTVSEQAAAKYLPRLLFEFYNQGFDRSIIYELMDKQPNPSYDKRHLHWGLLRADGSRKPAFRAVRNVIDILDNSDLTTTTQVPLGTLDYDIKGDMTDVHQTLLQKQDGRFYLVLWQEVNSYDLKSKIDLKVPIRTLNILFNTDISQLKVYKPNWKAGAVRTVTNPRRYTLGIPDRVIILELTPDR
ncbi:hypothetical protein [Myxosarcina sp. GI1]|uniref:hypothetical protein n=1 Tax=Myxosarcina sp. GI1 TaxID=1541065 RepID=UPI0005687448|nr:hypothetical protein [Myxosarcina sp. GI1]